MHQLAATGSAGLNPVCKHGPDGHALGSECPNRFTLITRKPSRDLYLLLLDRYNSGLIFEHEEKRMTRPDAVGGAEGVWRSGYLAKTSRGDGFKCVVCRTQPIKELLPGQRWAVAYDVAHRQWDPKAKKWCGTTRSTYKTVGVCPSARCLLAFKTNERGHTGEFFRAARQETNWSLSASPDSQIGAAADTPKEVVEAVKALLTSEIPSGRGPVDLVVAAICPSRGRRYGNGVWDVPTDYDHSTFQYTRSAPHPSPTTEVGTAGGRGGGRAAGTAVGTGQATRARVDTAVTFETQVRALRSTLATPEGTLNELAEQLKGLFGGVVPGTAASTSTVDIIKAAHAEMC